MPTYLCHGFRWARGRIRTFVILENIDEAAPDWVIGRGSSRALLRHFARKFEFVPELEGSGLALLEEYDPEETCLVARPWAYVADYVVRVGLSASLEEERARYEARHGAGDGAARGREGEEEGRAGGEDGNKGWFERLSDELQLGDGEPIGWYVVVCGDEERHDGRSREEDEEKEEKPQRPKTAEARPSLRHKVSRVGLRLLGRKD